MKIKAIPCLRDNYIWQIQQAGGRAVAFVDPGDAAPVLHALDQEKSEPVAILLTHHHQDHVGAVLDLLARYPHIKVFGPAREEIPGITHPVGEGDRVQIPGTDINFLVLDIPGHTKGHVAYYGHNGLFCGDTLFSVGCGRLFEGTPEQMYSSLSRIAALPADTLIYCAHEYTLDNIRFARQVEPGNTALSVRESEAFALTDQYLPTLPSTLATELATNPFLRHDSPELIAAAEKWAGRALVGGVEVFAVIRRWKDGW